MRTVYLDEFEMEALSAAGSDTEPGDGWPEFLSRLEEKVDRSTGCLHLDGRDLEQIPRYAFDYGKDVWQTQLVAVFGRALGPRLGR
jgi:hypothetical protein